MTGRGRAPTGASERARARAGGGGAPGLPPARGAPGGGGRRRRRLRPPRGPGAARDGRQPFRARCRGARRAQPLTAFLRPEPAVKRGTFEALISIGSPVRGCTPWRALRSATWNLPNPENVMSLPRWSASWMTSRTASTALPASLFPRSARLATWSTNSDFVTLRLLLDGSWFARRYQRLRMGRGPDPAW